MLKSGIYIPGDAKALIKLKGINSTSLIAASQNKGPLKLFKNKNAGIAAPLNQDDKKAFIILKNGKTRKEENYHGNSFLSQSSRFISVNSLVKKIEVVNIKGKKRVLNCN